MSKHSMSLSIVFAAALATAGLAEVVAALPDGTDTVLGPEFLGSTDLSGGQWQRLALARALRLGRKEPARARQLATAAREALAPTPEPRRLRLADIDAFLRAP